jgi:hypothetical protein
MLLVFGSCRLKNSIKKEPKEIFLNHVFKKTKQDVLCKMLKHGSIVTKIQMVSNKTTGQDNFNEEIK